MLLALFISVCTVHADGQWSPIAKMGVGPTDGCFSFSLHGKGYVGGGSNGSHFYAYDTTANTWTLKGSAPAGRIRGFGIGFMANNHGYAGCGDTCSDLWMYNDTTNAWTQKTNFPGGQRNAMLCFVINDTAYAGGGFDPAGGEWNDFYKYNPFTDTWTPLGPLPVTGVGFPAWFVINGKGYLAGGEVGTPESNGLWEYDPHTDTWTAKASYPGAARQTAFGFAINNLGYVGGGMAQYDTTFTDMWRYNPVSNTWTASTSFPSKYAAWSTAFTIGNTAYVGAASFINTSTLLGSDSFRRYRDASTTGLAQAHNGRQITVCPNPANDHITVSGDLEPGSAITLTDMTGRAIRTFVKQQSDLYIGDLPQGMYLLRCIGTTGIFTERIIKK